MKAIRKIGTLLSSAFVLGQIAFADEVVTDPGAGGDGTTTGTGGGTQTGRGFQLENPLKTDRIEGVVSSVGNFLFGISAALLTVFILVGAYQIMTSGGNPDRVSQGRKTITWALIGFLLVIIAGGAASIIGDLVGADVQTDYSQAAYEQCVDRCILSAGAGGEISVQAQECIAGCAVQHPDATPISSTEDIILLLQTISRWMFGILMALGIVFILYAAFLYLTSGGDADRTSTARQALTYAIIAMVVGVLAGGAPVLIGALFE